VKRLLYLRQCRKDQRLQQCIGDAAEGEDGEDDPRAWLGGSAQDRMTLATEALKPFGIRPRHVAALIELRDHGES
jgi:hypothetical protein